jgi:hypothetical protein
MEKTIKKVCHCQNCGNEAEMIITCSLPEKTLDDTDISIEKGADSHGKEIKGTAVCKNCGNEADMWVKY